MTFVSLLVSALAFGVSLAALLTSRKQSQVQLFVDFHSRLLDPDLHRGRRLLLEGIRSQEDVRTMRASCEDDYFSVNRALATLDALAGHASRRWISADLVLDEWGPLYQLVGQPARHFAAVRAEELGLETPPWPHLHRFCAFAERRRAAP